MHSITNPLIGSISMGVQCVHVCVCRQHVCSSLTLDTPEEVPEIEYIVELSWSGQQIYTQAVVNPHSRILNLTGPVLHLLGKLSQETSQENLNKDWEVKVIRAGRGGVQINNNNIEEWGEMEEWERVTKLEENMYIMQPGNIIIFLNQLRTCLCKYIVCVSPHIDDLLEALHWGCGKT